MEEMNNQMPNQPAQPWQPLPSYIPPAYRAEGRELILALFLAISGVLR